MFNFHVTARRIVSNRLGSLQKGDDSIGEPTRNLHIAWLALGESKWAKSIAGGGSRVIGVCGQFSLATKIDTTWKNETLARIAQAVVGQRLRRFWSTAKQRH